jgi:aminoglycoside phosphotransferase (APT) family kinase protein
MLRQADIVPYLLRHRLVSPRSVVASDLGVFDASSRNRNYRVVSRSGPSYLVKIGTGDARSTVAREAAIYERLAVGAMAPYIPRFDRYDPEEDVLVIELVDGEDLHRHHADGGRFATSTAAALGRALATLHRETWLAEPMQAAWLPWALSVHRPDLNAIRDLSAGNIELVKIVQRFGDFREELDAIARDWRVACVIHNDVKLDNCIVPESRRGSITLVDWELSAEGDPSWDIGSVFSHYLSLWLLSMPITVETPPASWPELAQYPLARMRPALAACWTAYADVLGLVGSDAHDRLRHAIRCAAARLLQTGIEYTQFSLQLTSNAICLLQLSLNVLTRPEDAAQMLLGLPYVRGAA